MQTRVLAAASIGATIFVVASLQSPAQNPKQSLNSAMHAALRDAVKNENFKRTVVAPGDDNRGIGLPKDLSPLGQLLIGWEIYVGNVAGKPMIQCARPIWLSPTKESAGIPAGDWHKEAAVAKAKPGYAVGKVTLLCSNRVDGMSITFMKIDQTKLNPKDSYESEWFGAKEGKKFDLDGGGRPAVGMVWDRGPKNLGVGGLGLIFADE